MTGNASSAGHERLFVPLNSEPFEHFSSGSKDTELRGCNDRFNMETVEPGRLVELRKGYNGPSIWGVIEHVHHFSHLTNIAEDMDHERITPGLTRLEFEESVRDLLGEYDHFIAFKINQTGHPAPREVTNGE